MMFAACRLDLTLRAGNGCVRATALRSAPENRHPETYRWKPRSLANRLCVRIESTGPTHRAARACRICRTGLVEHHLRREHASAGRSSDLIKSARRRYEE